MSGRTYLIVGATGNTGKEVVRTLAGLLDGGNSHIIALTRSLESETVKSLSGLPGVEFLQYDWTDIDAEWLTERKIQRAFIAPQNGSSQFADESAFHLALLQAGVEYVVRTATVHTAMTPSSPIWYGRQHWAIQTLLQSPEFDKLAFTSLCPSFFTITYLSSAVQWVKDFRKSGKQTPLKLSLDADGNVGMIDPNDVGKAAAHLLALNDISEHKDHAYVLSGPEEVNGRDLVKLVESAIGTKVAEVEYRSTDFIVELGEAGAFPKKFVKPMIGGLGGLWDGSSSRAANPTSEAIMKLAPPSSRVADAFHASLD